MINWLEFTVSIPYPTEIAVAVYIAIGTVFAGVIMPWVMFKQRGNYWVWYSFPLVCTGWLVWLIFLVIKGSKLKLKSRSDWV